MKKLPLIVQVDENGKAIGPVEYKIAHPKDETCEGIRHAVVSSLIFEDYSYKKVLLQKRGLIVATGKNKYDSSAGGHINWLVEENRADTPKNAVYKEINEELFSLKGIPKILKLEYLGAFHKRTRLNDPEFLHLFEGVYSGPFFQDNKEVSELRWEDMNFLLRDIKNNPDRYTRSLDFVLDKHLNNLYPKNK